MRAGWCGRVEVVFLSGDHDAQGFGRHRASMPWPALPHAQRARYRSLAARFGAAKARAGARLARFHFLAVSVSRNLYINK